MSDKIDELKELQAIIDEQDLEIARLKAETALAVRTLRLIVADPHARHDHFYWFQRNTDPKVRRRHRLYVAFDQMRLYGEVDYPRLERTIASEETYLRGRFENAERRHGLATDKDCQP